LISRKYTKRIEFWQVVETADGYGGYTVSETLITKSWANIRTPKNTQRLTDFGITDTLNTLSIKLRNRNDVTYNAINQFIKYNGIKYVIKGIVNTDLLNTDIEILVTREMTNDIEVITPIGTFVFDDTFDLTFN